MTLLHRPIGLLPLLRPSIPISCLRISPPSCVFARHGSMKFKRIQKRQPLEKNRLHRLIKGTRLEVKKERKKKHVRNSDPMAYMDIQPVEFDPFDIRGRSTLKIRRYMPITPGMRHQQRPVHDHLWKGKPLRVLTVAKRSTGGRNNSGKVTVRHRGGGHRRRIRIIDYQRREPGPQTVLRIEYDPGRSGHIALVQHDETGKKTYILAAEGLRAGDKVESYRAGIPKSLYEKMGGKIDPGIMMTETIIKGNCLPLRMIPLNTVVFAIGIRSQDGAKLCRAAGSSATVLQQDGPYSVCKLASGEIRKFNGDVCATIGVMSNEAHQHIKYGKAGRKRWLGIRPTVRGVAMNANEHPHGGGRGKSKGNKHTRSVWGWKTKGARTRAKISRMVIRSRPRGRGGNTGPVRNTTQTGQY